MKASILLSYFIAFFSAASASPVSSNLPDQPDSVAMKVNYYMLKASQNTRKNPTEALKYYRSALKTNTIQDELWEANIRTEMGKLLSRVKNKEAVSQFVKADALYKKNGSLYGRTDALNSLARFYEHNGNFAEAQKKYDDLIKIQLQAGEAVLAGNTAYYLTETFIKKKNLNEAFKYADLAKNMYDRVCRKDSLGAIYYKIALIKRLQNKPKLAEFYVISKALPFFSASDNMKGRMQSFEFLGNLYFAQKRMSEAKWFYLQANTQSRSLSDTSATIKSLINLTVVKAIKGDLSLAKQDFSEADSLSKTGNYSYLIASFKTQYPTIYKKINPEVSAAKKTNSKETKSRTPKATVQKIVPATTIVSARKI